VIQLRKRLLEEGEFDARGLLKGKKGVAPQKVPGNQVWDKKFGGDQLLAPQKESGFEF